MIEFDSQIFSLVMETPFSNARGRRTAYHVLLGHGTIFEENEFGDFANARYNDYALLFGSLNGFLSLLPGLVCAYISFDFGKNCYISTIDFILFSN